MAVYTPTTIISWSTVTLYFGAYFSTGNADKPSWSLAPIEGFQNQLNKSGFNCGTPDGIFGSKTYAAVVKLQQKLALKYGSSVVSVDGIVGQVTWTKFFSSTFNSGKIKLSNGTFV
jgi:hypothetical protein